MHRNLVVVRAGDKSLHEGWLAGDVERNWDIIVSYFGTSPDRYRRSDVQRVDGAGPKWPALHDLFIKNPTLLASYDYVWLPDDDLETDLVSINRLFDTMRYHDLEVAQPALTWNSYFGHLTTLKNTRFLIRFTNYVEVMAPCLAVPVLQNAVTLMNTNLSGWGLDFAWHRWVRNRQTGMGIIDDVTVRHTRPVGGPNYQKLREGGISPWDELREFCRQHGLDEAPEIRTQGALTTRGAYLREDRNRLRLVVGSVIGVIGALRETPERRRMMRRLVGMAVKLACGVPDRVAEQGLLNRRRLINALGRT